MTNLPLLHRIFSPSPLILLLEAIDLKYSSPTHPQNADIDFSALGVLINGAFYLIMLSALILLKLLKEVYTSPLEKYCSLTLTDYNHCIQYHVLLIYLYLSYNILLY